MTSEPPLDDREAVSPELVLVSTAEVAQRAREELPEVAVPPSGPTGEPAPPAAEHRPAVPAYPRILIEDPPAEPTRHLRRRWVVLLGCVLGAAAAAGAYRIWTPWHHRAATPAAARPAARPITTAPSPVAAAAATGHTTQTTTQAGFVPSRSWGWLPHRGAAAYEVTFFLDGRVVLRARTEQPRFVLPRRFRFHAGRYRWTVRILPPVAGQAIVDSTFVLTPAAAAAANGA